MEKEIIENTLLKTFFNYIAPFFNNDYSSNSKKIKNINQNKTKFEEIRFLEQLVLESIKKSNNKSSVKVKKETNPSGIFENKQNIENKIDEEIESSLEITKRKENEEKGYSVSITYEENESEERINVSIKTDNYNINKLGLFNDNLKKAKDSLYSFSITKKKERKDNKPYSIKITYEDNYEQERLTINYRSILGTYLNKRHESLTDFSDRVPGKAVNVFPESVMGGVLGFTYLGDNSMGLRADLTGNLKKMVDIHESIHTPDEYETRILTDWIMSKERVKYIR